MDSKAAQMTCAHLHVCSGGVYMHCSGRWSTGICEQGSSTTRVDVQAVSTCTRRVWMCKTCVDVQDVCDHVTAASQ